MPFFLFLPFSSPPLVLQCQCCPSPGFSQGSAVMQRSCTRFPACAMSLGMPQSSGAWGYAAALLHRTAQCSRDICQGCSSQRAGVPLAAPVLHPGPCSPPEKRGRLGLCFISFPSLHSSLYLMVLNFSFLKITQTGTGS